MTPRRTIWAWMLAPLAAAALAGGWAFAQQAPSHNAFVYWNLVQDGDGVSLVSDRDYHRPEGLRVTFSCQPGAKKITVREYLDRAERSRPSVPLARRDGRFKTVEQCDAQCARHSDTVVKDYLRTPGDLAAVRPQRYAEAQVNWRDSTKTLIERYLLDPTQFGDAKPGAVQTGLTRQRNLVRLFQEQCRLK